MDTFVFMFHDFLLKYSTVSFACLMLHYLCSIITEFWRSMFLGGGGGRGEACSICLELPNCPVGTNCGHTFCAPCILRWQHEKRPEPCQCPVCRRQVDVYIYNTVYSIVYLTYCIAMYKNHTVEYCISGCCIVHQEKSWLQSSCGWHSLAFLDNQHMACCQSHQLILT